MTQAATSVTSMPKDCTFYHTKLDFCNPQQKIDRTLRTPQRNKTTLHRAGTFLNSTS